MEMIYVDIFVAIIRYRSFFCLFTSCRRTEDDTYTIYRNRLLCIKCEYFRPYHVIQNESKYLKWTNIHEIEGKKQQQKKNVFKASTQWYKSEDFELCLFTAYVRIFIPWSAIMICCNPTVNVIILLIGNSHQCVFVNMSGCSGDNRHNFSMLDLNFSNYWEVWWEVELHAVRMDNYYFNCL